MVIDEVMEIMTKPIKSLRTKGHNGLRCLKRIPLVQFPFKAMGIYAQLHPEQVVTTELNCAM